MDKKPRHANDARSEARRGLRIRLLIGATGIVATSALLAALEPKIPPFSAD